MPAGPAKKILLMRHAKPFANSGMTDFDRPLTKSGKGEAVLMGKYLDKLELIPGQIISSPAARAKATTLQVARALAIPSGAVRWEENLYYGAAGGYLAALQKADDRQDVVMTVGHNPMTEQIIRRLSGKIIPQSVPTAAIACFETSVNSWSDLKADSCRLLWMVTPADLAEN